MEKQGHFIVFEGIDGSGKSTQVRLLGERLRFLDIRFHSTVEPTRNPIGKLIRDTYLSGLIKADERVLRCLFAVDRLDHITSEEHGLYTKIRNGINIIQDRGCMSNIAYRGPDMEIQDVLEIHKGVFGDLIPLKPTVTIFLDVDPKISMERVNMERSKKEIYETIDRQVAIRAEYFKAMEILKAEGETFEIIDGSLYSQDVAKLIWDRISCLFE